MNEAERLERNTQTARDFYDLMFNQSEPAAAIERYAGEVMTRAVPVAATTA